MLKVNEAKVEQARADLQAKYDGVVAKANNVVANIPGISDSVKDSITAQLVDEYGKGIKDKLDFVLGFFDDEPEEPAQ